MSGVVPASKRRMLSRAADTVDVKVDVHVLAGIVADLIVVSDILASLVQW